MMTGIKAWPQRGLMGLVRGYQLLFSAWVGGQCRFVPSCSAYAMQALARHGAARGSLLAAGRVLRCHPWCAGGCDPVPATAPPLFRHLVRARRDDAPRRPSRETIRP